MDTGLPRLLLLHGPPCAGKTHVSDFILREFVLPAMSKDIFKEVLYETLGWSDRAWSRQLSQAAMSLLYAYAHSLLAQGQSCMLEANFVSHLAQAELTRLFGAVSCQTCQIFVCADRAVLAQRFRERARRGHRHPGNLDHILQHEYAADSIPAAQLEPIPVPGPLLRLDTTHMSPALNAQHQAQVTTWLAQQGFRRRPESPQHGSRCPQTA